MKKLFLKNGMHVPAYAKEDNTGKYICICEYPIGNEQKTPLRYSIHRGNAASSQMLIFAEPQEEMKLWELQLIVEIYESFDQYFNNLNQ